ncbi:MAG: hypothetical protein ACYDHU_02245 [Acidimicrobiales bacterium]
MCEPFPRPQVVTDPDKLRALEERAEAMEARARNLVTEALAKQARCTEPFGRCRVGPQAQVWIDAAAVVTAYRERWDVRTKTPLGGEAKTIEWIGHRKRAEAPIARALAVAQPVTPGVNVEAPAPVPTLPG